MRERLAKLHQAVVKRSPDSSEEWTPTNHRPFVQTQRRLTDAQVTAVRTAYIDGSPIDTLAQQFGINRTTVIAHLERGGIQRRKVVRKMTDALVAAAAEQYASGDSILTVAKAFKVNDRTLRREFLRAGVPTRPRRGG